MEAGEPSHEQPKQNTSKKSQVEEINLGSASFVTFHWQNGWDWPPLKNQLISAYACTYGKPKMCTRHPIAILGGF